MEKRIITISREFGSGGRTIGKLGFYARSDLVRSETLAVCLRYVYLDWF